MFVGLAGEMLIWFGLSEEPSIWWATATSAVWLVLVMRKG
jgi:predicted small integral membrane protein